ncbi:Protein PLANT CADMIUM RESISTANCE 2 [Phytophthora ramorum]|uniref:PLAC8 family protein n=1 Tax=Phytophthora ramorum TaxID=164328 RepID=H3H666_PHYRM|nr:Protein PLANT CADMIUM RESISTANCE 2 [Phytophthora ramorum]
MSQTLTTETPAKRVEVPYSTAQPANPDAMKDLESEDELTREQWQVGFWDCFTTLMPNCFMVTILPCVSIAQVSARLGVATYSNALVACLAVIIGYFVLSNLVGTTPITILCHIVFALFVMHLRMQTRERFQIPGDTLHDFFASFCCSCCALAQMATHIKSYTPGSCDFGPVADTLPAYAK